MGLFFILLILMIMFDNVFFIVICCVDYMLLVFFIDFVVFEFDFVLVCMIVRNMMCVCCNLDVVFVLYLELMGEVFEFFGVWLDGVLYGVVCVYEYGLIVENVFDMFELMFESVCVFD